MATPRPRLPRRMNAPKKVIATVDELPYLCTASEAGLLLRLSPEAVARKAKAGELHGVKQGKGWLFRRDDLVEYMDKLFRQQ